MGGAGVRGQVEAVRADKELFRWRGAAVLQGRWQAHMGARREGEGWRGPQVNRGTCEWAPRLPWPLLTWHSAAPPSRQPLTPASGGEPGKRRRHGSRSPCRHHSRCNYRLELAGNVKFAVAENLLTGTRTHLFVFHARERTAFKLLFRGRSLIILKTNTL